jgi:hypothetical protein
MTGHGAFPTGVEALRRLAVASQVARKSREPPVVGDAVIPGFRHFLDSGDGTLDRADRFKINDQLPTFEEKSQETLQDLMGRLAHRMSVPYGSQDNPRIPAGYTYLMQLMAHDLVQSSVAVALVGEETGRVRNHRQSRLRLDTIYGAGPDLNAFAYALEDASDSARTRLRLGRMAPDPIAGCPFRDIARVLPANQTEVALPGGCTDALIADSRNDDHAILSQFTALIHLLHNGIVANLLPKIDPHADPGAKAEAACSNFLCARAAVTLIYRNIIRKDLMQQVLHPAVYATYKSVVDAKELIDIPDERIPLEFSHAAYRFGHCMVRNTYKINAIPGEQRITAALLTTSSRGPLRMPLGLDWIVGWSNFFEIGGIKPNLSQRIRPTYSPGLLDDHLFPSVGATRQPGLASRDLFSGAELGLWSVDCLIGRLRNTKKLGIPEAILRDKTCRTTRLVNWLSQHRGMHTLRDEDIATLAKDPPLLFYVQFEAWEDAGPDGKELRGEHLGVLGSVIVADAVFGALADRLQGEDLNLATALQSLSEKFFGKGPNVFAAARPLDTMSELIVYVARLNRLENAQPAFL